MSRSSLKDFAVCPSKWIKYGDGEDDSTSSTEWGSLVDCLLLERDKFEKRYAIKPDQYPVEDKKTGAIVEWKDWNANSNWCKNWLSEHDGQICISSGALKEAKKAVEIAENEFDSTLGGAQYQVCIRSEYHDKETGLIIPICCLIDVARPSDALADFKTARSADPSKWPKEVHARWYDAQGALYLDAWNAATGENLETFVHLIQENEHPYECSRGILSVEFIKAGRAKYLNALRLYCQCLASGKWATYNDLAHNNYAGRFLIEPESWMVEEISSEDPSWISERAA